MSFGRVSAVGSPTQKGRAGSVAVVQVLPSFCWLLGFSQVDVWILWLASFCLRFAFWILLWAT